MPKSSSSKFGIIAIFSTVAILLLIIALALFSFLVKPNEPEPAEVIKNPVFVVTPADIDPALAIARLGGVSTLDIVDQAVSKARPGTALAGIVFSPDLTAKDAAGALLLLAGEFFQRGDKLQARLSYQLAGTLATLSPELSDTLRADIFLQAGLGLTNAEAPILAKIYLDQAFLVATESNYLQPAYRRTVLERLGPAYLAINLKDESRKSLEMSMNPPSLQALPENPLVLPVGKDVAMPQEVQEAENVRWRAAQAVAKELVEKGGTVNPATLDNLRQALLKEDSVKMPFYNGALQAEPQLSGKVNLIQSKINWQSTKYRVAKLGFGLSLVPEWESQAEQVRSELTSSYEDLYRLYGDMILAMPDASQIDRATEEALRHQILAGQLGQYPNYPAEKLKEQLLEATARLVKTQPGTELRVSFLSVDGVDYYTLISDKKILNQ